MHVYIRRRVRCFTQASIQERMDEGKMTASPEAAAAAAAEIGYGAVKYYDLRQHPSTSYVFRYGCLASTANVAATQVSTLLLFVSCFLCLCVILSRGQVHVLLRVQCDHPVPLVRPGYCWVAERVSCRQAFNFWRHTRHIYQ